MPTLDPAIVFRRYEVDGVPDSGPHDPEKAEIVQLLQEIIDDIDGAQTGDFESPIFTDAVGATRVGFLNWAGAASGQTWAGVYYDDSLQRLMVGALTGGASYRPTQLGYQQNSQVMIGAVPAASGDPVQDAKLEIVSPLNQRAFRSQNVATKNSTGNDFIGILRTFEDNPAGNDASVLRAVQYVRGNNEGFPHSGRAFHSRPVEFHGVVNQGVGNIAGNQQWGMELTLNTETNGNGFDRSVALHIMEMGQIWALANRVPIDCAIVVKCQTGISWFERYYDQTSNLKYAVRGDGQIFTDANITTGGADYAEMFEWEDGNPDQEDRTGCSVAVAEDGKIRIAAQVDDPIGVVSVRPTVIGDNSLNWPQKFVSDDLGRPTSQLNPSYRPNKGDFEQVRRIREIEAAEADHSVDEELRYAFSLDPAITISQQEYDDLPDRYVPRDQRSEWAAVGLMGKLRVRKGQVIGSNWRKLRSISDHVDEWLVR